MRKQTANKGAGVMGHTLKKKVVASILALTLAFLQFPVIGFADDGVSGAASGSTGAAAAQPAADNTLAATDISDKAPGVADSAAGAVSGEDAASDDSASANADGDAAGAVSGEDAASDDSASANADGDADAAGEAADETPAKAADPGSRAKAAAGADKPATISLGEDEPATANLEGVVEVATEKELLDAVAAAGVTDIVLSKDIVIDKAITIDREITISGASLSRSDRTKSVFVVGASGDLTLTSITLTDNGADGNTSNYASAIVTSGVLNLNAGAVVNGFKAADGGAVTAESGSNVNINGATLSNNTACGTSHAAMGGAVYAKSGSTIEMASGTIDGNVACSANNPNNRNGGIGGGFYIATGASMTMENGTISNNQAGYYSSDQWTAGRNGAGGGVFVNTKAGFVMKNGAVSDNTAWAGTSGVNYYGGGGICIWNSGGYDFSGLAQINAGSITGNTSVGVGGGVYVHNYRLLPMHSAAVVANAATINGGGLYLCMVGEVYNYATDCTIFTNNAAAASDYAAQGDDIWSDEPWYGSKANFHLPERTESGLPITWYEDTSANPYTDASEPIDDFPNWFESNKSNNVGLHCDATYDAANYAVLISRNTAKQGGGIGCNGILEMCNPDADDVSLTVKKVWADDEDSTEGNTEEGSDDQGLVPVADLGDDPDGGDQGENPDDAAEGNAGKHPPVTMNIYNGEVLIDSVVLSDENNWTATLTGLPADGAYSVIEEEVEGYKSTVTVEQTSDTSWEFTITNAYAEAFFEKDFTKYLYSINMDQTFSFTMAECDDQGEVLDNVADAVAYERDGLDKATVSADDPITITVKNGQFNDDCEAAIDFPQLRYTKPGTHYYRVSEDGASASGNVAMDDSWFLLCVEVTENQSTGEISATLVSQKLFYDDDSYECEDDDDDSYECEDDELAFYNNELMTISCFSMDYGFAPAEAQELVIQPAVMKELNGRALAEGEFAFQMVDTTDGGTHAPYYAENDAQGKVAFDTVSFAAPGVYTYNITEVAGRDATVAYDSKTITMTVDVTYDDNGALQGSPIYSVDGAVVDVPTFVNTATKPIVRVQKTSKDGSGDPLHMAYYGLWMKNDGGSDVYLGAKPSDEDGYITFDDVDMQIGESYYFKEVSAPAGHTVDEYPSDLFKVVESSEGYSLVYEGDENFDAADYSLDGAAVASLMALGAEASGEHALMALALDDSSSDPAGNDGTGNDGTNDGSNASPSANGTAPTLLTYTRNGKGVQDEVVKLEVSKFDKDTHEWVEGAEFEIIDEATGNQMAKWTTGKEAAYFERVLNVNTRYVLHETKAPEGYAKAADTVFTVGEYGDLQILDGKDAELTGKTSLSIYDDRLPVENNVVKEVVDKTERTETTPGAKILSKTGDNSISAVGVIVGIIFGSGLALVMLLNLRRRSR